MPGLDGFETCRAIRQRERLRRIPILFLTGEEDRFEVIKALNEGASDYVSKKADFTELKARVQAHIRNKRLLDEINRRKAQIDHLYQELSRRNKALQEELEIARDVQNMMLLTDFSRIFPEHIAVSSLFIPTQNISGDFYDVFPLNTEEVVILVADVAGHGVPAALISSMAKVLVQNLARRYEWPHEVACGLNNELIRSLQHHMVTLFYGVYNVRTRRLRYTNAGHPPALLYRRGKPELEELFTGNPVTGVFPPASYDTREHELAPGDRIIIYTDGITEAYSQDSGPFSSERLKDAVLGGAGLEMAALKDHIVSRCRTFTGSDFFADDISLLIIEILQ
jgi:serine phosphatase RsbU (regulator of sigma subunit)